MERVNSTSGTEIHEDDHNATQKQFPLSFSIFALARSHRALAAQLLREIDLFPGQELILMQLWKQDRQSQNRLSQNLRLDHSTIAKSVKRLEDTGLVARSRSPEDGRELESRVLDAWNKLESITSNALTQHEKTLLIELLNKVTHETMKYDGGE
ncbi:MarR family winged helix-turn-helix transcriptional regulator [Paenibacillus sp. EPM92]|uniref:MarR family winged helix-turn-helix transcriptional regulator n=1 Tax=Paenibacillus sp. EPM92 TaxID=1561195 RepID=UPI0019158F6D|nr:MarR family transcriptional regulator [Paenibacillus sp. EPM92]